MNMQPKHKQLVLQLTEQDGNAWAIIGRASKLMQDNDIEKSTIQQFTEEATSGDYEHLIKTCVNWFDCQ